MAYRTKSDLPFSKTEIASVFHLLPEECKEAARLYYLEKRSKKAIAGLLVMKYHQLQRKLAIASLAIRKELGCEEYQKAKAILNSSPIEYV
jgi:hypothetical protein